MNKIKSIKIKDKVKELFLKANYYTNQDLMKSFNRPKEKKLLL
jgi:tartrate dehydratase alpha subunit/fumarate hydratase class I-like protein